MNQHNNTAPALEITAPNDSGSAQCIVRWQIETPKGWIGAWNREALDYLLGRAPADNVLEDAARYRWLREQSFDTWKLIAWNTLNNDPAVWPDRDAAIDAARKQGGKP